MEIKTPFEAEYKLEERSKEDSFSSLVFGLHKTSKYWNLYITIMRYYGT